jgi:hypothetical protein
LPHPLLWKPAIRKTTRPRPSRLKLHVFRQMPSTSGGANLQRGARRRIGQWRRLV